MELYALFLLPDVQYMLSFHFGGSTTVMFKLMRSYRICGAAVISQLFHLSKYSEISCQIIIVVVQTVLVSLYCQPEGLHLA